MLQIHEAQAVGMYSVLQLNTLMNLCPYGQTYNKKMTQ